MPKNYQISQYEEPLAEEGWLKIEVGGGVKRIGIQRLHLEEDVGKLVHEGTLETAHASLVDYNRAGVPLMETVSKPELRSPEEAAAYLRAFRAVLVYLGVCDGNMEEGTARLPRRARVPRSVRRQHGGRLAPLRRQHLTARAWRERAWHQGGDQEPELVQERPAGARVRRGAAGPRARRRRAHRAGDAGVVCRP